MAKANSFPFLRAINFLGSRVFLGSLRSLPIMESMLFKVVVYRGAKIRSQLYLGVKTDTQLYLGVKSLF